MPLSAAHLRELADRVEAEEEEERRKLADAETQEDREQIKARLDQLEARNAELEKQLADRSEPEPEPEGDDGDENDDDPAVKKPKMRKGRKRGQVYQDGPGQPGYVYQGEDEDDLVPVDQEDAA